MNGRQYVKEQLIERLPLGWTVLNGDKTPTITGPTALVGLSKRSRVAGSAQMTDSVSVVIVGPWQTDSTDKLEALLDTACDALDETATVLWDDATYIVYDDKYPAYLITVDVITRKEF